MKSILIVCESGISAALFVSKFIEKAQEKGDKIQVDYASIERVGQRLKESKYDILLLTPQVRRHEKEIGREIGAVAQRSKLVFISDTDYNYMAIDAIYKQVEHAFEDYKDE